MLIDGTDTVRMPIKRKFWPWGKYLHFVHGEQVNLVAPNHYNSGGGYVCRYDKECRSMAYEYWDCNGKREPSVTYCPPPGYPPKLDSNPDFLPQSYETRAVEKDRKEKKIKMGKKAWKDYERKRKNHEKVLKKQYKEWKKMAKVQDDIENKQEKERGKQNKKDGKKIDKTHF